MSHSKKVTLSLGEAIDLASRRLIIRRFHLASDQLTRPAAQSVQTLAGSVTNTTVTLPDNYMWQAVLQDYKNTGEISRKDVLNFHTGDLQFPGPKSGDRLSVYSIEDMSSSSGSSASSQSTSSSSESSPSASESSSSHSSVSSQSTSSSSHSTSSSSSGFAD